MILIAEMKSQR